MEAGGEGLLVWLGLHGKVSLLGIRPPPEGKNPRLCKVCGDGVCRVRVSDCEKLTSKVMKSGKLFCYCKKRVRKHLSLGEMGYKGH